MAENRVIDVIGDLARHADALVTRTKYLEFRKTGSPLHGAAGQIRKTIILSVLSRQTGMILGEIKWYAPWRCYTFFPGDATLFNAECLNDIIDVVRSLMLAWRNDQTDQSIRRKAHEHRRSEN